MAGDVKYDLCPETGIGCVLVKQGGDSVKIDLMPDEAADLKDLVASGDMAGAKALLESVDSRAATAMDDEALKALAKEMG